MTAAPPLRGDFETVADAFVAAAEQFGDRESYVDGDRRLTFAEWYAAADAVAARLVDDGVRPGDVVALMLPSSADYAVCHAAIALAGAVSTGLNPRLGSREVAAILERAAPTAILRQSPAVSTGHCLETRRPRRRAADPAVIIWTSGTTGVPKGAWFDHDDLRAAAATAGVITAPFDRRLSSTPFAHAGYMAKLWEQLAWGMTIVISPPAWSADDMLRLLVAERITVAGAVPTQWAKLLEHAGLDAADLSSLRMCVTATAPAPPELVERMTQRLGCPVIVRYAMSEAPSMTGTEPGDPPEVLYRTVGRPQAGVEIQLRDNEGATVPAGEVGRIHIRSAHAMRGYWGEPGLTAEVIGPDGWLRSGDLGYLDAGGNPVLAGRTGDMYIRGGYNVYPIEVENVLSEHPAVEAAAVVGVPAEVIGEIGVAFVVAAHGHEAPSVDDLKAWCRERLADYKAPDEVVFIDALPLTPMLKVDKQAVRGLAQLKRT